MKTEGEVLFLFLIKQFINYFTTLVIYMLTCPGGQASVGEQQNVESIITEPVTSARIVKLYDLAFHQF